MFPPTTLGSAAAGGTAGVEAPRVPLRWGTSWLEPCAANAPGAALSEAVYTAQRTGGLANRGSPAARRGNLFPRDPPVQAISLLRPSKQPPAGAGCSLAGSQPGRQPAGRAASGPGARQPLLSRGHSATEKSAHLGSRCEQALGAGGRPAAPSRVLRGPGCATAGAAACLHAG